MDTVERAAASQEPDDWMRQTLMQYVKEYYLADISVCDRLIDLFQTARKLGFSGPGRTGNYEINKKVKDSEDLAVEKLPQNHPQIPGPDKSGYNAVMKQFSDFIPRYYTDTKAAWRQPVAF